MYKDVKSATQRTQKEALPPPQMDKASKMLAKFGWKEGQGLGKNEQVLVCSFYVCSLMLIGNIRTDHGATSVHASWSWIQRQNNAAHNGSISTVSVTNPGRLCEI